MTSAFQQLSERPALVHTDGVSGSIPLPPTMRFKRFRPIRAERERTEAHETANPDTERLANAGQSAGAQSAVNPWPLTFALSSASWIPLGLLTLLFYAMGWP